MFFVCLVIACFWGCYLLNMLVDSWLYSGAWWRSPTLVEREDVACESSLYSHTPYDVCHGNGECVQWVLHTVSLLSQLIKCLKCCLGYMTRTSVNQHDVLVIIFFLLRFKYRIAKRSFTRHSVWSFTYLSVIVTKAESHLRTRYNSVYALWRYVNSITDMITTSCGRLSTRLMALIVVMLFMRVYAIWQSNKILVGLSGAVLLVSLRRYIFQDVRSFIAITDHVRCCILCCRIGCDNSRGWYDRNVLVWFSVLNSE